MWQFAPSTVAAIPALYQEHGWGVLADVLPAPFFVWRFLDVRLWQWIALLLLAATAAGVSWIWTAIVGRIFRMLLARRPAPDGAMVAYTAAPLRLGLGVAAFAGGLPFLRLAARPVRFFVGSFSARST